MTDETRDPLEILRGYATPPSEYVSKLPKGKEDKEKRRTCSTCGGYHDPGMFHLDYVGHADVTRILLEADPRWNWEPLARTPEGLPLFERDRNGNAVGLWIRLTVGGMTRLGYGSCEANKAEAEKELIGDALRNAAMRFGVALDLWSKSDAGDGGGRDTAPDRRKPDPATQAQLDELLAELEELLDQAADIGADGDPEKAREYAGKSPAHARKAIQSVHDKIREALATDDDVESPAPAEAGSGEPQPAPSDEEVDRAPEPVKPAVDDAAPTESGPDAPAGGDPAGASDRKCQGTRHVGPMDRIGIARTQCRGCGATGGPDGPGTPVPAVDPDAAAPADAEPVATDTTWRVLCEDQSIPKTEVLNTIRQNWSNSSLWNRPNKLSDIDRMAATEEYGPLVRGVIDDLVGERASA